MIGNGEIEGRNKERETPSHTCWGRGEWLLAVEIEQPPNFTYRNAFARH